MECRTFYQFVRLTLKQRVRQREILLVNQIHYKYKLSLKYDQCEHALIEVSWC